MDQPDKALDERFGILLRRVEKIESWVAEVERNLQRETRETREHASAEANAAFNRMAALLAVSERSALQVRVSDALWFAGGVALALFGSVLNLAC